MQNHLIDIKQIEKHYCIEPNGQILSLKSQRYLKPIYNTAGHSHVCLFKYKRDCMIPVARLVAEKYLGAAPPKAKINHIDFNIANNDYTNLEYSTLSSIIIRSHFANKRVFSTR